jgi:hypothetical protein
MEFTAKNIKSVIFFTAAVLLVGSCSDEVSLVKPGPPVPVVYGILDVKDPHHYIKLSKSFAGEVDAYELAQDPDRIFYSGAEIKLTRIFDRADYRFQAVDTISRLPGPFPALPNKIYLLNSNLFPAWYKLSVTLPEQGDTLSALFHLMADFTVLTPKKGFKKFYLYDDPTIFSWNQSEEAGLYEIAMTMNFEEHLVSGEIKEDSVTYTKQLIPETLETGKGTLEYRFYSDGFYASIPGHVKHDPAVDFRKPTGFSIHITAADTVVSKYIRWFNLEIDDKVNPNGNIAGAIGVIGSKNTIKFTGLTLSNRAQDSLVRGRYTKNLSFAANTNW